MRRKGFTIFLTQAEDAAGWGDDIAAFRRERKFSRVVKDGIRLVADLMNGKTDVLLELFPFVVDAICPQQTPPDTSAIDEMKAQLARMEQMLKQRPVQQESSIPDVREYGIPAMKQSGSGIGTLGAGRVIAMPTFDDEPDSQDTIVLNAAVYQNTGANFAASLANLGN